MRMGLSKSNIIKYKYRTAFAKIFFAAVFFSVFATFVMLFMQMRTAFLKVLVPHAINIGSDAINNTVEDYFTKNQFDYDDFVKLSYNDENEITSVQTKTALMNKVKADLSIYLQDQVTNIKASPITMPLGNIFNNPIFSGLGPDLRITVKPTDITDLVFSDKFESCGINQVRHKIYIEVFVNISVHCASMSKTELVEDTIPIAETVIVGRVPQYYGNGDMSVTPKTEEE